MNEKIAKEYLKQIDFLYQQRSECEDRLWACQGIEADTHELHNASRWIRDKYLDLIKEIEEQLLSYIRETTYPESL